MRKLLLPIAFLFMFGCATSQICSDKAAVDSVICPALKEINLTPETANLLFQLANVELIRAKAYIKADVLEFFDDVEAAMDVQTYSQLVQYMLFKIAKINKTYGAELVLITQAMSQFQEIHLPISQFDKDMLSAHIFQQRQLLVMVE